jgi:hypothetical protein
MYRLIHPEDRQELPLRMLFHPAGDSVHLRACEGDSFRALVAALLDDPGYEQATAESRLVTRLRLANDGQLLAALRGHQLTVGDHDGPDMLNVASDEPFIRSLDRAGIVSLPPAGREGSPT